eukprot:TRINITY_DN499_c0_g1_i5.p1 TRINITY_DN499_c0_g1~~TRINITY_DN499_c0_g1_i5.p1  ORF type:complete len:3564 (-),score=1007.80 TRINITY_DN499_c0_g1_i5:49-10740(-)
MIAARTSALEQAIKEAHNARSDSALLPIAMKFHECTKEQGNPFQIPNYLTSRDADDLYKFCQLLLGPFSQRVVSLITTSFRNPANKKNFIEELVSIEKSFAKIEKKGSTTSPSSSTTATAATTTTLPYLIPSEHAVLTLLGHALEGASTTDSSIKDVDTLAKAMCNQGIPQLLAALLQQMFQVSNTLVVKTESDAQKPQPKLSMSLSSPMKCFVTQSEADIFSSLAVLIVRLLAIISTVDKITVDDLSIQHPIPNLPPSFFIPDVLRLLTHPCPPILENAGTAARLLLVLPFLQRFGKTKSVSDAIVEFGIIRSHLRDIVTIMVNSGAPDTTNPYGQSPTSFGQAAMMSGKEQISKDQSSAGMISLQLCCMLNYVSTTFHFRKDVLEVFHTAGGNDVLLRALMHLEALSESDNPLPLTVLIFAIADFASLKCSFPDTSMVSFKTIEINPMRKKSEKGQAQAQAQTQTQQQRTPQKTEVAHLQNYEAFNVLIPYLHSSKREQYQLNILALLLNILNESDENIVIIKKNKLFERLILTLDRFPSSVQESVLRAFSFMCTNQKHHDASSEIKCFGAIILDRDHPAQPHTLNNIKKFIGKLLKADRSYGQKLAQAGVLGALLAKVINDITFIHAVTGTSMRSNEDESVDNINHEEDSTSTSASATTTTTTSSSSSVDESLPQIPMEEINKLLSSIVHALDAITFLIEGSQENADSVKAFEGLGDVLSLAMQHSELFPSALVLFTQLGVAAKGDSINELKEVINLIQWLLTHSQQPSLHLKQLCSNGEIGGEVAHVSQQIVASERVSQLFQVISSIIILSPAPHRARSEFLEAGGFEVFSVIAQHIITLLKMKSPISELSPLRAAVGLIISSLNVIVVLLRECPENRQHCASKGIFRNFLEKIVSSGVFKTVESASILKAIFSSACDSLFPELPSQSPESSAILHSKPQSTEMELLQPSTAKFLESAKAWSHFPEETHSDVMMKPEMLFNPFLISETFLSLLSSRKVLYQDFLVLIGSDVQQTLKQRKLHELISTTAALSGVMSMSERLVKGHIANAQLLQGASFVKELISLLSFSIRECWDLSKKNANKEQSDETMASNDFEILLNLETNLRETVLSTILSIGRISISSSEAKKIMTLLGEITDENDSGRITILKLLCSLSTKSLECPFILFDESTTEKPQVLTAPLQKDIAGKLPSSVQPTTSPHVRCRLPTNHQFPYPSGYSISLWFFVDTFGFNPISLFTLLSSGGPELESSPHVPKITCFLQNYGVMGIKMGEKTFFVPNMSFVEGSWHHIAITHKPQTAMARGKKSFRVFVDGSLHFEETVDYPAKFPPAPSFTLQSPHSAPVLDVGSNFIPTPAVNPNDPRKRCSWRLGPLYVFEQSFMASDILSLFLHGPNGGALFGGSIEDLDESKSDQESSSDHSMGESISSLISPRTVSIYERNKASDGEPPQTNFADAVSAIISADHFKRSHNHPEIYSKQRIIQQHSHQKSTAAEIPYHILNEFATDESSMSSGPLSARSKAFISRGCHVFPPLTLPHSVYPSGGALALLYILDKSETKESLEVSVKLLVSCVLRSREIAQEMKRINGHDILALSLKQHSNILTKEVMKELFSMCTGASSIFWESWESLGTPSVGETNFSGFSGTVGYPEAISRLFIDPDLWLSCPDTIIRHYVLDSALSLVQNSKDSGNGSGSGSGSGSESLAQKTKVSPLILQNFTKVFATVAGAVMPTSSYPMLLSEVNAERMRTDPFSLQKLLVAFSALSSTLSLESHPERDDIIKTMSANVNVNANGKQQIPSLFISPENDEAKSMSTKIFELLKALVFFSPQVGDARLLISFTCTAISNASLKGSHASDTTATSSSVSISDLSTSNSSTPSDNIISSNTSSLWACQSIMNMLCEIFACGAERYYVAVQELSYPFQFINDKVPLPLVATAIKTLTTISCKKQSTFKLFKVNMNSLLPSVLPTFCTCEAIYYYLFQLLLLPHGGIPSEPPQKPTLGIADIFSRVASEEEIRLYSPYMFVVIMKMIQYAINRPDGGQEVDGLCQQVVQLCIVLVEKSTEFAEIFQGDSGEYVSALVSVLFSHGKLIIGPSGIDQEHSGYTKTVHLVMNLLVTILDVSLKVHQNVLLLFDYISASALRESPQDYTFFFKHLLKQVFQAVDCSLESGEFSSEESGRYASNLAWFCEDIMDRLLSETDASPRRPSLKTEDGKLERTTFHFLLRILEKSESSLKQPSKKDYECLFAGFNKMAMRVATRPISDSSQMNVVLSRLQTPEILSILFSKNNMDSNFVISFLVSLLPHLISNKNTTMVSLATSAWAVALEKKSEVVRPLLVVKQPSGVKPIDYFDKAFRSLLPPESSCSRFVSWFSSHSADVESLMTHLQSVVQDWQGSSSFFKTRSASADSDILEKMKKLETVSLNSRKRRQKFEGSILTSQQATLKTWEETVSANVSDCYDRARLALRRWKQDSSFLVSEGGLWNIPEPEIFKRWKVDLTECSVRLHARLKENRKFFKAYAPCELSDNTHRRTQIPTSFDSVAEMEWENTKPDSTWHVPCVKPMAPLIRTRNTRAALTMSSAAQSLTISAGGESPRFKEGGRGQRAKTETPPQIPQEKEGTLTPSSISPSSSQDSLSSAIPSPRRQSTDSTGSENDADLSGDLEIPPQVEINSQDLMEITTATEKEKVRRLLEPNDKILNKWNVGRVFGMDQIDGVFVVCTHNFYVLDGFIVNSSGEIVEMTPEQQTQRQEANSTFIKRSAAAEQRIRQSMKERSGSGGGVRRWRKSDILSVLPRRHMLRDVAIEIFSADGHNDLLVFDRKDSEIARKVCECGSYNELSTSEKESKGKKFFTDLWTSGKISNFEYLMRVNTLAGRSFNDWTQYPVFPWIIADYTSAELDLNNPKSFRDLSKPMGALGDERAKTFLDRYEMMKMAAEEVGGDAPFHYGTHYSNSGTVLYFLVRMEPYSHFATEFQEGQFDHADRLFSSIQDTWKTVSEVSTSQVIELVPEFFYNPQFLVNSNKFDLGICSDGKRAGDVQLPPWAHGSPHLFVQKNLEALESPFVSAHLNEWIDLIFGFKQQGEAAIEAMNVFHHLSYEGAVDLDTIDDPVILASTLSIIQNFGQTPRQLWTEPHPKKTQISSVLPPLYENQLVLMPSIFDEYPDPIAHIYATPAPSEKIVACCKGGALIPKKHQKRLVWGYPDKVLRIFTASNKLLCSTAVFQDSEVTTALVLPVGDGQLFAGMKDSTVRIASVSLDGRKRLFHHIATLRGHTGKICALNVSRPFNLLVSGDDNGECIAWDLTSFRRLFSLKHGLSPIVAVDIDPVGGDILTCSSTIVKLWTVNGQFISEVSSQIASQKKGVSPSSSIRAALPEKQFSACIFGTYPQSHFYIRSKSIITGHDDGTIIIWDISTSKTSSIDLAHAHGDNGIGSDGAAASSISGSSQENSLSSIFTFMTPIMTLPSPSANMELPRGVTSTGFSLVSSSLTTMLEKTKFVAEGLSSSGAHSRTSSVIRPQDVAASVAVTSAEEAASARSCAITSLFVHQGRTLYSGDDSGRMFEWGQVVEVVN